MLLIKLNVIMNKNWQIKLGILLVILSGIAFAFIFIIPLLEMDNKYKIIGSSTAFILMEVFFWIGGILIGKELFVKYKSYLNPRNWTNKKDR